MQKKKVKKKRRDVTCIERVGRRDEEDPTAAAPPVRAGDAEISAAAVVVVVRSREKVGAGVGVGAGERLRGRAMAVKESACNERRQINI